MYDRTFWNERYGTHECLYGTEANPFLVEHVDLNHYDSVVSISAHLPSAIRNRLYPLIEKALTPGGILLLEAYSEGQLARDTGGPKDMDMLMSVAKLRREFPHLEPVLAREIEREVREGKAHTGVASVVQYIARKKSEQ